MSTRETILAAIQTVLLAAGAVTALVGTRVYRTRREQIATVPAIQIEQDGIESEQIVLGYTDHTMDVVVTAFGEDDTPDKAPDATLSAAHAALMADPTLGQSGGVQILPNYSVDAPNVDGIDFRAIAHRYRIFFRTATNAL